MSQSPARRLRRLGNRPDSRSPFSRYRLRAETEAFTIWVHPTKARELMVIMKSKKAE